MQVLAVAEERVAVTAHRDVELARAVHPVEAVVAGLVQVDRPGRPFREGQRGPVNRADPVVVLGRIAMAPERLDDAFDVVPGRHVAVDELRVDVREEGLLGLEGEEERAPARERLEVPPVPGRHPEAKLIEELPLAAGPLEERPRLGRVCSGGILASGGGESRHGRA